MGEEKEEEGEARRARTDSSVSMAGQRAFIASPINYQGQPDINVTVH